MQKNIRKMQQTKPITAKWEIDINIEALVSLCNNLTEKIPINVGPISRNSTVLNPFSPVPTNAITKPIATVPKPTYRKAFANELGPLKTPRKSSSSDDPPSDESCTCNKI